MNDQDVYFITSIFGLIAVFVILAYLGRNKKRIKWSLWTDHLQAIHLHRKGYLRIPFFM